MQTWQLAIFKTQQRCLMKIIQINCVFRKGSTGRVTAAIHDQLLQNGDESQVIYGRGERLQEKGVLKVCSEIYAKQNALRARMTGLMYGGCELSTHKIIRILKKEQPDLVHLQCINGNFVNIYKLIAWLRDNRIATVLTLHAEFMYTANCGHAFVCEAFQKGCGHCPNLKQATKSWFFDRTHTSYQKMSAAFDKFDEQLTVVSVSPWLRERAEHSPILSGKKHCVILNGVDDKVFHYRDASELRKKHNVKDRKVVFHATAMFRDLVNDPKGGAYVLALAERMKDAPVLFFIAGKYEIQSDIPDNVVLLGEIQDPEQLAAYYAMADLTVIASQRETFSMVCAESLCCGTPVVGFCAGGPEQIAIPEFSTFVPYGDLDALNQAAEQWLHKEDYDSEMISQKACDTYSQRRMTEKYIAEYKRILCAK